MHPKIPLIFLATKAQCPCTLLSFCRQAEIGLADVTDLEDIFHDLLIFPPTQR